MERIYIKYDTLQEFYNETNILEIEGNAEAFNRITTEDKPHWRGLSLKEILDSKYSYYKDLKNSNKNLNLGGGAYETKWSDIDGENMSYDRLLEGLPFLRKKQKINGIKNGKYVTISVNLCEPCGISANEMIHKADTVIQLIDILENNGIRVAVNIFTDIANVGRYKNINLDLTHLEINIKQFDEPLLKTLIYTCITPWMFRYHIFRFLTAKFNTYYNLGSPANIKYINNISNITINTGDCLTEESTKEYIAKINKLFEIDQEEILNLLE